MSLLLTLMIFRILSRVSIVTFDIVNAVWVYESLLLKSLNLIKLLF